MDNKEKALLCHKEWNGKLETIAKSKVTAARIWQLPTHLALQNLVKSSQKINQLHTLIPGKQTRLPLYLTEVQFLVLAISDHTQRCR